MTRSTLSCGRDPFARRTIRSLRHKRPADDFSPCAWCGTCAPWILVVEIDDDRNPYPYRLDKEFCSMSCARAYHE